MTRPELRPLTSVRGLFAWAVVLFHFRFACSAWAPPGLIKALAKGYLAVDFFFLLSGFVIWLNYGDRLRQGGGTADFLVKRIARIWPLHAAMLAFIVTIASALLLTGRPTPHFPFAALPLHLAMMQNWGFSNGLMWNDPAWSISCEWMAYLLAPIAALLLPKRRLPTPLLLIAAIAPLLALHGAMHAAGLSMLGADIPHWGLPRCLAEFASGAMLSALWRRWRGLGLAEAGAWVLAILLLAGWALHAPETLVVPLAFAALLFALAIGGERPGHPLSGRAIHYLGEISYATYLSHFLIYFVFKLLFVENEFDVPPALLAVFFGALFAVSAGLHHWLERPAQRAILRWWAERKMRRAPAQAEAR